VIVSAPEPDVVNDQKLRASKFRRLLCRRFSDSSPEGAKMCCSTKKLLLCCSNSQRSNCGQKVFPVPTGPKMKSPRLASGRSPISRDRLGEIRQPPVGYSPASMPWSTTRSSRAPEGLRLRRIQRRRTMPHHCRESLAVVKRPLRFHSAGLGSDGTLCFSVSFRARTIVLHPRPVLVAPNLRVSCVRPTEHH